ncbi:MAG TPA: permease-like cell division protein FtsX [Patescibacteria group bacterium]|nr:permease-like cell division protein FtsX [Patescibacteria group bacterium]
MERFSTVFRHMRRIPYQALAAIIIMALTTFASTVVVIAALTSARVLSYFETRPQITTFFTYGTSQDEILTLKQELENTGKVSEIRYVSQEEAFEIYKEQNKDEPLLLEQVSPSILPASLEISAKDATYLDSLQQFLEGKEQVEEVVYQKDVVDSLLSWGRFLRQAGLILLVFLLIESILIIIMVTGMKIALKRSEIEIMKLLGATTWYIRTPFLLEGVFYGFIGSFLAVSFVSILLLLLNPNITSFFTGIPGVPLSWYLYLLVFFVQMIGGMLVGAFGSMLAVWRYLHD